MRTAPPPLDETIDVAMRLGVDPRKADQMVRGTVNLPHGGGPKQRTEIGRDVRVGVDTVLVAPLNIGDDAWTAAGTVVTDDVPENALVGFPPRQVVKEERGGRRND